MDAANGNDIVFVKRDNSPPKKTYCTCDRKKYLLVPLVVVNYLERKIDCSVDPQIFEDLFIEEINSQISRYYSSSADAGIKIVLSFQKVPRTYSAHFKGHCFIIPLPPFVIGLRGGNQKIGSPADSLSISYSIYNSKENGAATVIREGTLAQVCTPILLKRDRGVKRKQFVEDYLNSWDVNMRYFNTRLAMQLLNQLKLEDIDQK
jgi:hypothetical protein